MSLSKVHYTDTSDFVSHPNVKAKLPGPPRRTLYPAKLGWRLRSASAVGSRALQGSPCTTVPGARQITDQMFRFQRERLGRPGKVDCGHDCTALPVPVASRPAGNL